MEMHLQDEMVQSTISMPMLESRNEETITTHAELSRKTRDLERLLLNLQQELAPVLSLPNELLSAIFEVLACDKSPTSPHIGILLSHVSRRFRDVAMNTRLLWTRIEVSLYTSFDMIIAYLQRSGSSPFDLCFGIEINDDSDSESEFDVFPYTDREWETIISYMTHCRRFSIRSNDLHFIEELIDKLEAAKAPLLQSFRIEYHDGYLNPPSGLCKIIIDGDAPALTSIWLEGWALHQCLPPLPNITSLTLLETPELMKWALFRSMFGGHLALTRLVIGNIFDHEYIPDSFESTIVLPSLKSLRICVDITRAPDPSQILFAISAPALEFLALDQILEDDLEAILRRPRLQNQNHFPFLRHLSIALYWGAVGRDTWIPFCNLFPSITHFTLRLLGAEEMFTKPFMLALGLSIANESVSPPVPPILPKLHTLSFNHSNVSTEMLCGVVSNREAAGVPLRLLQLPTALLHNEALASSLDWLRERVEVGEYQAEALEGDDDDI